MEDDRLGWQVIGDVLAGMTRAGCREDETVRVFQSACWLVTGRAGLDMRILVFR